MRLLLQSKSTVFIVATILSFAISYWCSFSGTLLNSDAICYIHSAKSMSNGIHYAMGVCDQAKWPFFAMIIAGTAKISGLSFVNSAYLVNAIFAWLVLFSFMSIVAFLGKRQSLSSKLIIPLLWFSALIILFTNEYSSTKYYIIRDHGYWAFYLLSIFFMLKFYYHQKYLDAAGWFLCLVVATLFRIEGAIFLALAPLFIWFSFKDSFKNKLYIFLKLNTFTIILLMSLIIISLFFSPKALGRINEIYFQIMHGVDILSSNFNRRVVVLQQNVLSVFSAGEAYTFLSLALVSWFVFKVIVNLSVIYTILTVYAWYKNLLSNIGRLSLALFSYVWVNIIITAIFLSEHMFLSKRYLIALSLTLMIWCPFALLDFYSMWNKKKWPLIISMLLIFVSSLGGIFQFGYSKQYIYQSGVWLKQNTPDDANVYSNDYLVMFYSERFGDDIFIKAKEYSNLNQLKNSAWGNYDYLAIKVKKNSNLSKKLPRQLDQFFYKDFSNKRGDSVKIYKIKK